MSKKYIYACIRIPIEIAENGHHITYNDHAKVDFEKCDELPPKSDLGKFDLEDIFKGFKEPEPVRELDPEPEPEPEPIKEPEPEPIKEQEYILKSEIKTNKRPIQNSTFKQRQMTSSRYSQKRKYS